MNTPEIQTNEIIKTENITKPQRVLMAQECGVMLGKTYAYYRDDYKFNHRQAHKKTMGDKEETERLVEKAMSAPVEQLTWFDLGLVMRNRSEVGQAVIDRMYEKAAMEIDSGRRSFKTIKGITECSPYDEIRYLQLRNDLCEQWRPVAGEMFLIDQMAQSQWLSEQWTAKHVLQMTMTALQLTDAEKANEERRMGWYPERVTDHDAMQLSALMIDRFHKMYIRSLRALRDLRRLTSQIVVQNAGQINVGQQQVNTVSPPAE